MSQAEDLRAKAVHYRQLARMLDKGMAGTCHELADRYDEDARAIDAAAPPQPVEPRQD